MILTNLILRKVKLNKFLSFKEAEYTNLKNYNVIIGKNSSGKSNLFKVFQMICDAYYNKKRFSKNLLYNALESESAEIVLEFEFSSEFRKKFFLQLFHTQVFDRFFQDRHGKGDYPNVNNWLGEENAYNWFKSKGYFLKLLVELKYYPNINRLVLNKIAIINKNQEFLIFYLSTENNNFQENVLKIEDVKNQRETLDRTFGSSLIKRNTSSSSGVTLRDQINQLQNTKNFAGTLVKNFKACFFENIFIIPEQRNFDPSMSTENINATEIAPNGKNLVKLLNKKTVKNKREWIKKFNEDLRYFIEDVEELKQDVDDSDNTTLVLKEKGLKLNLYYENMGAGILNVAHFIACLMENPKGRIICIQEPELYLHPGLERKLRDYFLEKSEYFTFYITTHSREFLSNDESLSSTYLTKREGAQTKINNIPLTDENFKLIYEDLDIDLTRIEEEKKFVNDPNFWLSTIKKIKEEAFEAKFWDFKQTLDFWHVDDHLTKRNKKIDFVEKVASFGNAEGGVIVIGVTDLKPRKVLGININENKLNELKNLILDLITPSIDFTSVQPITLKNDDNEDVLCVCVVIAQTSHLIGVKHDNDTIKYVLRTSTGSEPVDPQVIIDKKRDIRRTNFNFIRVINNRLNQNP